MIIFIRWETAKAQICTALVGLLGKSEQLFNFKFLDNRTIGQIQLQAFKFDHLLMLNQEHWLLWCVRLGGFLNIALVSLVPDLMQVRTKRVCENMKLWMLAFYFFILLFTMMQTRQQPFCPSLYDTN